MGFENWDEIRTAFQVARLGTVSAAAEALGVHHATVIRHVDALERRLGVRLFTRHARGYAPTEAGRDLLLVAQATDEQFGQLASRIKGLGETVAGELVVTSLAGLSPLLAPALAGFQRLHPALLVRFLTDARLFRLDYGEAHVAIRAGAAPQEPDNVVQPLVRMRHALVAAPAYAEAHGLPSGPEEFAAHRFVGADVARAPYHQWLADHVPHERIVFRASEVSVLEDAVRAGAGLGFLPAIALPGSGMIEVTSPRPEWEAPLWLVTHVDLHRTRKVQEFLSHLKAAARGWTGI